MQSVPFQLLANLIEDPTNGWSIGSFGAIGEFMRDIDESVDLTRTADAIEIATARGAMRIVASELRAIAWDSLSPDGESWGHEVAFCAPRVSTERYTVAALGDDCSAINPADRRSSLFDLGIAAGCVRMCVRSNDPGFRAFMSRAEGHKLFAVDGAMAAIMDAQPHRVMLSPAGRLEVFQPIPATDGQSPLGPHTHVLPHVIPKDRPHSSNVPIPDGWQAALSMHPRSPWCSPLGERHPYDPAPDAGFAPLLARYGLDEDEMVAAALSASIGGRPEAFEWPSTRRARHKARIVLRRLAAAGDQRVGPWLVLYDRSGVRQ